MKRNEFGLLVALSIAIPVPTPAAERLQVRPGAESLDYLEKNRAAALIEWEHPVYPPEPDAEWVQQAVRVAFEVDPEGRVVDARAIGGSEKFAAVAVATVSRWRFRPELVDGQPALATKEVRVTFSPKGTPKRKVQDDYGLYGAYPIENPEPTPPGEPANSEGAYPPALLPRRLSGEVELLLGIDQAGRVEGVEVYRATHPEFLSTALETVAGWQLRPARLGRIPQPGQKRAVVTFLPLDDEGRLVRADWLERNGIFLRTPADTKTSAYFDHTPEAVVMVDPVYPYALLQAGITGGARVNFTVTPEGVVTQVRVDEATEPEFGESVAAAISSWVFQPLSKDAKACWADFSMTWRFEALTADSVERRLVDATAAGQKPVIARQLDRPPAPLFLRQPVYPATLREAREAGEAQIELIIDREGRVRLPQIRSATRPEFGWAAVTAVSQWLFETPRRAGEPVDVRVLVPVEFKAPSTAE